jgi:hypothetical protein
MGLSTGYMGNRAHAQQRPRVWDGAANAAVFGGGVTVLAFAVYGVLAGVNLVNASAVGPVVAAIALAFAAHYVAAKLRTRRAAQA